MKQYRLGEREIVECGEMFLRREGKATFSGIVQKLGCRPNKENIGDVQEALRKGKPLLEKSLGPIAVYRGQDGVWWNKKSLKKWGLNLSRNYAIAITDRLPSVEVERSRFAAVPAAKSADSTIKRVNSFLPTTERNQTGVRPGVLRGLQAMLPPEPPGPFE